jgi:hypothetical protein
MFHPMGLYATHAQPYQDLLLFQKLLIDKAQKPRARMYDIALALKHWVEAERLKREMRGLPPLAPHKVSELLKRKEKRISSRPQIIEIDPPKESLSSTTVTAPPPPAAP